MVDRGGQEESGSLRDIRSKEQGVRNASKDGLVNTFNLPCLLAGGLWKREEFPSLKKGVGEIF
jgi:hypothetical protein